MKKGLPLCLSFAATCLLVLALAGPAQALGGGQGWRWHHKPWHRHHHAPELDPSLLGNGLILIGGSILVLVERRRRR